MKNWQEQLKREFGIHFKNSPDELQFLEAFIEDLLNQQKEEIVEKLKEIQQLADKEQALETDLALQELLTSITKKTK